MFDTGSEFKREFSHLLKDFGIKPVFIKIKNPHANSPVDQVRQVILYIIVTKDLANKVFDYVYPWGETLSYIEWVIRASYHLTVQATPC